MITKTFLIEIGTEELPHKKLNILVKSFAENLTSELSYSNLLHGSIHCFATSRRLAIKIENLATIQSNNIEKKIGPPIKLCFDKEGNLTEIVKKWAYKNNIFLPKKEFFRINDDKRIFFSKNIKGKKTKDLIPNIITKTLNKLNINNSMYWGNGDIKFIRPIHTVTLLLGKSLINTNILGIKTNRIILGHRFMGEKKIKINDANEYPYVLQNHGNVIADFNIRKQKIKFNIEKTALKLNGTVDLSCNLLDEVTALVEWPIVLVGKFDKQFLTLPNEILVHIMKYNQKYFPIYNKNGKLIPNFIFISNIQSKNPNKIIKGNENIIFPRFSDAKFFFEKDCRRKLEDNLPFLKDIVFHQKLGNLIEKTYRLQKLSCYISKNININIEQTNRAALLSKCDLVTNMVFEFPEVQGTIGMYYAINDGESKEVAIAIKDQYYPRFSNDKLPSSKIGCSLSIADKIDNIVGIIGISKYPRNNRDPFALRRAALGILNIIINEKLFIDLKFLVKKSIILYEDKLINSTVLNDVIKFILNRLNNLYIKKGYDLNIIQSVLAMNITKPLDFDLRIKAISSFVKLKQSSDLFLINKRLINILVKSNDKLNNQIKFSLLKEKDEIILANYMIELKNKLKLQLTTYSYKIILIELLKLSNLIKIFFDKVTINCNNKILRTNRLNLISELRLLFLTVVDMSLI